jgi:hypothetical protein
MDTQTKILAAAVVGIALVVAAVAFQPAIEESLAPELVIAWVAVEVGESGLAEIGPVEIEAGTPFTLHAVVEAKGRSGPVYYTEAKALALAGREVDPERLRRWERPFETRVRWFTIEGNPPFVELATAADLERFRFQGRYRPDWPLAWSVPGEVEPAPDDHFREDPAVSREFGTQRFHVAVELYDKIDKVRPRKQVRSWGADDVLRETERFPAVRRALPGRLAAASRVFGLTHLEAAAGAPAELSSKIDELARRGLAFSRATVLRDHLEAAGKTFDGLAWRDVDLVAVSERWGDEIAPGDLLRVGERFVVIYEDRGRSGLLDYEDLCFDYARGAAVRRLAEVFTGEGVVELASL